MCIAHTLACTCRGFESHPRQQFFSLGIWFVHCMSLSFFYKCLSIYHVYTGLLCRAVPAVLYCAILRGSSWVDSRPIFCCPCSCVCARLQSIAGMCPGLARCPEFLLDSTSASREMTWQAVPSLGTRYIHVHVTYMYMYMYMEVSFSDWGVYLEILAVQKFGNFTPNRAFKTIGWILICWR